MTSNKNIVGCVAAACLTVASPGAAQTAGDLAGLLDRVAPSIVTVKVVIKTEMTMMGQAQNEESRSELRGVIVDESGLIMISNAEISADRMKEALGNTPMGGSMDLTVTPTDFKVFFGNEEGEHAAFLVAKDTTLDLAFLQVEDVDRELTAVNLADSTKAVVGQQVVVVTRLAKGYDYAPMFETARISGSIKKPRRAWIVSGALGSYGLPVFASSGEVIGVLVTLAPTTKDEGSGGGGFGSMMRFMSGGGLDTGVETFVLPGSVVDRLVGQSKQKAQEMLAEQATGSESEGD